MSCLPLCEEEVLHQGRLTIGEDFICPLPFGACLSSKGGVIRYTPPQCPPANGVYTNFSVYNGAITEAGIADATPIVVSPYAPAPSPCGSSSSNSDYSGISIRGGAGILVSGEGSSAKPYVITATGSYYEHSQDSTVYIQAGNDALILEGAGTPEDPYVVSHKETGAFATIAGMDFDRYGHLIRYTAQTGGLGINDVVAGYGIEVTKDNATKIVTVGLQKATNPINDVITIGQYNIVFDEYNRVHKIVKNESHDYSASSLVPSEYIHNCTTYSNKFSVTLAAASSLKIEIVSKAEDVVAEVLVYIDGKEQHYTISVGDRNIIVSSAVYAEGTHEITVLNNSQARTFAFVSAVEA